MSPKGAPKQAQPGLLPGAVPGAADGRPPQALTFALLEAQRSDCNCRPCQLLRKAVTGMADQLLQEDAE
ncbi:MAG: hypothetical protein ACE5IA_02355 [Dehalococcoidia bacterium]